MTRRPIEATVISRHIVGWGLRSRAQRTLERVVERILPERASLAFHFMLRHRRSIGVYPNIIRPRTFSEKVLHRIIFDRRLIWPKLQDKYLARAYVTARLGGHVLPRLYWSTTNPSDIPFDALPQRFVVKPTHGSGWCTIVRNKAALDKQALVERCQWWLGQRYFNITREWGYKLIEPRILVEEYVDDGSAFEPIRYKFFVFHGTVAVINVWMGPTGDAKAAFYDRRWNRLPGRQLHARAIDVPLDPPSRLGEMIAYAETLAAGLDFIRVDLYATSARVYFGEFTTTPWAGLADFEPREFDKYLGQFWTSFPLAASRTPSWSPQGEQNA